MYGAILHGSLRPERIASGIERSLELEVLARVFAGDRDRPRAWPLVAAEREALEDLDVPYFTVRATSTTLDLGPGWPAIASFFRTSGFDALIDRVRGLDPLDLDTEVEIIEGAFAAGAPPTAASAIAVSTVEEPALSTLALVAAAEAIARMIADRAVRGRGGAADWFGLVPVDDVGHFEIRPVGPSLYEGVSGTALFLAAIDAVRGDSRHRDLVLGAAETAVRAAELDRALPIGGATGLGSVVYALVRIAGLARMPHLVDAVRGSPRGSQPPGSRLIVILM